MPVDAETINQVAQAVAIELIRKSGVREFESDVIATLIGSKARFIAYGILGLTPPEPETPEEPEDEDCDMALPDYFRVSPGTAKTIKSSSGDAAITLASLANGSYRQAANLDLGASWARRYRVETDFELAATPTAGNAINLYGSWSNANGAGRGNTSGSDASYTGYSSNAAASVKQLEFLGAHICTAQPTSTVQKGYVGIIEPKGRYLNLVIDNASGAAFHSSDTNCVITLTPLTDDVEDT